MSIELFDNGLATDKMVLAEEEITRLFRVRKTVLQMLKDRGYFVGDFEVDMSREQFKNKYGESMKREDIVINKAKRNDSSDQVLSQTRGCKFLVNSSICFLPLIVTLFCTDIHFLSRRTEGWCQDNENVYQPHEIGECF